MSQWLTFCFFQPYVIPIFFPLRVFVCVFLGNFSHFYVTATYVCSFFGELFVYRTCSIIKYLREHCHLFGVSLPPWYNLKFSISKIFFQTIHLHWLNLENRNSNCCLALLLSSSMSLFGDAFVFVFVFEFEFVCGISYAM